MTCPTLEDPFETPGAAHYNLISIFDKRHLCRRRPTFGSSSRYDHNSFLHDTKICSDAPSPERYEIPGTMYLPTAWHRRYFVPTGITHEPSQAVIKLCERTWPSAAVESLLLAASASCPMYSVKTGAKLPPAKGAGRMFPVFRDTWVRASPGAYEPVIKFAKRSAITGKGATAHPSFSIGKAKRVVDFLKANDVPASYHSIYCERTLVHNTKLSFRKPCMLSSAERPCCDDRPMVSQSKTNLASRTTKPVHKGLQRALSDLSEGHTPNRKPHTVRPRTGRRHFGGAPRPGIVSAMRDAGQMRGYEGAETLYDSDPNTICKRARCTTNIHCRLSIGIRARRLAKQGAQPDLAPYGIDLTYPPKLRKQCPPCFKPNI